MKKFIILLITGLYSNFIWGQTCANQELKMKLMPYFFNIPIFNSADSIFQYVANDTAEFKINKTGALGKIETIFIYPSRNQESIIYYWTKISEQIQDSTILINSEMAVRKSFGSLREAKKYSKAVRHELATYFQKAKSIKRKNSLFFEAKSEITFFYINKFDKTPFMSISWNRRFDMFSDGVYIQIYRSR